MLPFILQSTGWISTSECLHGPSKRKGTFHLRIPQTIGRLISSIFEADRNLSSAFNSNIKKIKNKTIYEHRDIWEVFGIYPSVFDGGVN